MLTILKDFILSVKMGATFFIFPTLTSSKPILIMMSTTCHVAAKLIGRMNFFVIEILKNDIVDDVESSINRVLHFSRANQNIIRDCKNFIH